MTRILYCNIALAGRSGTEVVTIETALGLRRLGHDVAVLVGHRGASAQYLDQHGIVVGTRPEEMPWKPDIVHANHLIQSLHAAAWYPDVPQVFMCHDANTWHSAPPPLSIVRRWLAVDEACEQRVRSASGGRASAATWLPNAVDLDRYRQRSTLPEQPKRALVLTKNAAHLEAIRGACSQAGLQLDALGQGVGEVVDDLHARLQQYDLVFATARMALEAMASGCAVVVVDGRGLAGMATMADVEAWRRQNFGFRLLTRPVTADALLQELRRYNPAGARSVSDRVRALASYDDYLTVLDDTYVQAMADFRARPVEPRTTLAELPDALRSTLPADTFDTGEPWPLDWTIERLQILHTENPALRAHNASLASRIAAQERILQSRSALTKHLLSLFIRGKR